ncbi:MAG: carbohydrate porin [Gluconacetobacter diazotrophicus]|nr:carbohydrate porin [Gluconacetobacter diazotrophicus]
MRQGTGRAGRRARIAAACGVGLAAVSCAQARAQPAPAPAAAGTPAPGLDVPQGSPINSAPGTGAVSTAPPTTQGLFGNLLTRSNLLGDMGGIRSFLQKEGITYGIAETSEVLGNATGGVRTGAAYDGLTLLSAGLNTEQAFGWTGGTFNVSALWIHGRNLSVDNLGAADGGILDTPSGIEAERTVRLWELWYDQSNSEGTLDLKIGQQSLDQEFITSTYTALFINTMMGWPALPSYDLYAGGPAYPLSSLGARLRGSAGPFTALLGVFDDDPPGGPFDDDDQLRGRERGGLGFHFDNGALVIGELQYGLNQPSTGQNVEVGERPGLPGIYRIGAWYDSGAFPDQRYDPNGVSLADPASTGVARQRRHNFAVYTSVDQAVWQANDGGRSVGVFLRAEGTSGDRNLVSFSTNMGVVLKAPFASRPNDALGVGYGLTKVSSRAAALDADQAAVDPAGYHPVRDSESFVELTYSAQVLPWWSVQPDLQYVFTPGGGVANPGTTDGLVPTGRIGNELILGVRTGITF